MGSLEFVTVAEMANNESGIFDSDHYNQLMAAADFLELMIVPTHFVKIVNELCGKQCISVEISSQILEFAATEDESSKAWKLFLEHIPKSSENWYWEFMDLLSDTAENRDVRNEINSSFEEELKNRKAAIQADLAEKATQAEVAAIAAAPEEEDGNFEEPRIGSSILSGKSKLVILDIRQSFEDWLNGTVSALSTERTFQSDVSDDEDTQPEILDLRSYQCELANPAVAGKNTIIVAPTGSGKTFVAVYLVRRHLETGGRSQSPRKVAFLVPTVNLIAQQAAVFKRFLRQEWKVKGIQGGQVGTKQLPKAFVVRSNDVLIMTPQILLNMMMAPSPDVDPVPLDLFSLLIFDECHHCAKGNPYNEIMTKYLDMKFDALESHSKIDLPQVVGLSASLGVGGAETSQRAREHVLNVCANMDAHMLSTVVENMNELLDHVYVPVDDLERVPHSYGGHPFSIHVTNLILKIEKYYILPMLDRLDKVESTSPRPNYASSFDPPQKKYTADYRSWIFGWLHELPTSQDIEAKQILITAFEHLTVYHNALFLNGHVPTKQAMKYITQRSVFFERNQRSEIDKQLIGLYREEFLPHVNAGGVTCGKNEMVEKLKQILLKEFRKRPDGRALIFVQTRELTIALAEYMNEEPELQFLQAARLTGVQASKEKGGQSAKEQVELLEKFRSGHHRVLIVTSVAEEGLDVEKCNLIVKYNHVSDEISMVQRRGRGRAAGSRSVLLAQEGCIEAKEMFNMVKEKMMMMAVDYIRNMGSDWFKDEVVKRQKQAYEDRVMENKVANTKRVLLEGKTYDLLCKKCDAFLVCSTRVRRIAQSHFVAVDPSIWNRVDANPDDLPKIFENMVQAGRIVCRGCGDECGSVIKYTCVYLPALKADAFVQQSRDGTNHRHHQRKWKRMTDELFFVEPVVRQDLRNMFKALKSDSLRRLEERVEFAERQQEELGRQQRLAEQGGDSARND